MDNEIPAFGGLLIDLYGHHMRIIAYEGQGSVMRAHWKLKLDTQTSCSLAASIETSRERSSLTSHLHAQTPCHHCQEVENDIE